MQYAVKTLAALTATLTLTTAKAAPAPLQLDVYTASAAGFHVTSTLIQGEKDAVLVDAQFTLSDAHRVAAMVLESGKTLKTIFITHAHPDHFFGLAVLAKQFPGAKIVATADVVEQIRVLAPKKMAEWKPMYGANLADDFIVPEALQGDSLELEGRKLQLIAVDDGEAEAATAVYVPEAKTLIAGDLAFNKIHLWLAEGRAKGWLANLERLSKELKLERVIAGHKAPGQGDPKDLLAVNQAYIKAFVKALKAGGTSEQVLARIKAQYPDYQLPIIAEIATKSLAGKQ